MKTVVSSGIWSDKAAEEAKKYGKVNLVFPKAKKSGSIPNQSTWTLNPNASYFYYCANETVDGVEFPYVPETNGVPIVSDMSSCIMTKKIDVSKVCTFYILFKVNHSDRPLLAVWRNIRWSTEEHRHGWCNRGDYQRGFAGLAHEHLPIGFRFHEHMEDELDT